MNKTDDLIDRADYGKMLHDGRRRQDTFSVRHAKKKEEWSFIMDFCQAVREATLQDLADFIVLVQKRKKKNDTQTKTPE